LFGPASGLSFSGLASGIDTEKVIEGLLGIQQARISQYENRRDLIAFEQTTFKGFEAQLLELQAQAGRLARTFTGPFDARTVTSSDEGLVTAAAGSSAVPGNYSLKVNSLAQNHQIASAGFSNANATLKTGTLEIEVGTGAATTVTIDSTNNTLQGLADAINNSGAGVVASVINDGSANPYRLLVTSKTTGAANQIAITNNLTTGSGQDIDLDPATRTIQTAADAQIVLGSGAGAITINSASNTVDNLVAGVSVTLHSADPGKVITLNVAHDGEAARSAIEDFVDSYNKVIDFIDERDDFDSQSQQGGIFLGNRNAVEVESALSSALNSAVANVNTLANRLSAVGVNFDATGRLEIDQSKLNQALTGSLQGVSLGDVKKLFSLSGTSTSNGITFISASAKTTGFDTPIEVDITQAATQASVTAGTALPGSIVIDGSNKDLTLNFNGKTATIQLTEATYDPAALAQELQTRINASADFGGAKVAVSLEGGALRITTNEYGSASSLNMVGGSALAVLGFTAGQGDVGKNVAGKFIINGVEETATGTGQILSASSGNAKTDGLQVRVTLTQSQVVAGPEGSVTLTRGLASQLDQVLNKFLDPTSGRLKNLHDSFQRNIDDINDSISLQTELMELRRESLVKRFSAMEAAVSRLKSMGDQLTAQLLGTAKVS
jgi:flagellar hook-associated protein 2